MSRPGTVLVHPDQSPADPDACRIIARAMPPGSDWPWYRLTGRPQDLPVRDTDLADWQPQSLAALGAVLGA